ncbi:helix-turn-helix domain-containing protein [Plantactinospora sp. CA-294935]|uniref:helix-turn-helix domain-containing protein n=1 Tax=Plantactinospora sp. CA-294935 TaxID=3240012 RepID=UPI003D920A35
MACPKGRCPGSGRFAQGAELSVSEVAERAGIGQSTASEQLTLLRRGGILTSRREGQDRVLPRRS